jgi:hypothetical protein
VRLILHRIATSELAKTVDQSLGGPEVTSALNELSDRMNGGDSPFDIAVWLLSPSAMPTPPTVSTPTAEPTAASDQTAASTTADAAVGGEEGGASLRAGDMTSPSDVTSLGERLGTAPLAKVINAMARDGLFGPRGRAFAESGSFNRVCRRIGEALVNERLNELVR